MSVYIDLLNAVNTGKKFKVDLINKSLWINKKQILKDGEFVDEKKKQELIAPLDLWNLGLIDDSMTLDENPWEIIEELYGLYKYSIPSERGIRNRSYFKALSADELNDADLAYGQQRLFMQAVLEGYVLLAGLCKWISWKNENHWFWQSNTQNDLIVLRNWI